MPIDDDAVCRSSNVNIGLSAAVRRGVDRIAGCWRAWCACVCASLVMHRKISNSWAYFPRGIHWESCIDIVFMKLANEWLWVPSRRLPNGQLVETNIVFHFFLYFLINLTIFLIPNLCLSVWSRLVCGIIGIIAISIKRRWLLATMTAFSIDFLSRSFSPRLVSRIAVDYLKLAFVLVASESFEEFDEDLRDICRLSGVWWLPFLLDDVPLRWFVGG